MFDSQTIFTYVPDQELGKRMCVGCWQRLNGVCFWCRRCSTCGHHPKCESWTQT